MNRLLLVDGSNLLFQMFYGMPARIVNEQGKAIQGTLGFVGALLKIIRMANPTHMAVLFDGEHENERTDIDGAYKANRPDYSLLPEEDSPFSQLPDVYRALDHLGIRHAETTVCETDDWIAAYALNRPENTDIMISSFDSDFFQLITDHVSILRYRGKCSVLCTPESIRKQFGIQPSQYADFKSLTGDAADNIRGADKVGPKTAAALIRQFGTLEAILIGTDAITKPSIRQSIRQNAERLQNNRRLITLTGHAEWPFSMEELLYQDRGLSTTEILRAIHLK